MMLTVGKHIQVLHETPESIAIREQNPRKRKRFALWCTCNGHRKGNGHCVHTLAIFQEHIRPSFWPYVTPEQTMPAKNGSTGKRERSRLDLERELVELRRRVQDMEKATS